MHFISILLSIYFCVVCFLTRNPKPSSCFLLIIVLANITSSIYDGVTRIVVPTIKLSNLLILVPCLPFSIFSFFRPLSGTFYHIYVSCFENYCYSITSFLSLSPCITFATVIPFLIFYDLVLLY